MTPQDLVAAAIRAAKDGKARGEMPIGAVVEMGGEIIASACTQDWQQHRRLIHADLLATDAADQLLGFQPCQHLLRPAVNLEPCLMCIGAAMALRVDELYFGLESPADGGTSTASAWQPSPDLPWYAPPRTIGGIHRDQVRDQFRRYCAHAEESGFRRRRHPQQGIPTWPPAAGELGEWIWRDTVSPLLARRAAASCRARAEGQTAYLEDGYTGVLNS